MNQPLSRDTYELVSQLHTDTGSTDFYSNMWQDMLRYDPEMARLLGEEALRLFPESGATVHRARATRLALEMMHAMKVNEVEEIL